MSQWAKTSTSPTDRWHSSDVKVGMFLSYGPFQNPPLIEQCHLRLQPVQTGALAGWDSTSPANGKCFMLPGRTSRMNGSFARRWIYTRICGNISVLVGKVVMELVGDTKKSDFDLDKIGMKLDKPLHFTRGSWLKIWFEHDDLSFFSVFQKSTCINWVRSCGTAPHA